ncbi:LysR family transcriptional regulator, partial [Dehalococcoides mccartyi]|nr:LysR family transcriptional regulator [Dehalococcoides mccartyi]
MELNELEAFYAVANYRSVTRAAESLHEAQSTISKRLKSLEQSAGGSLFHRDRRPLLLTPLGERMLTATTPFMRTLENVQHALNDEIHNPPVNFMLTYPVSENILLKAFEGFSAANPNIHFRLRFGSIAEVATTVDNGEVEFGLAHGTVSGRNLSTVDLGLHDKILISPLDHPILDSKTLNADAIAQWPLIVGPIGGYNREVLDSFFRNSGVRTDVAVEVQNNVAMKRLVMMGLGLAIIPRIAMEDIDYTKLGIRSLSKILPNDSVNLIQRSGDELSERSSVFMDRVTNEVKR